MMKSLIKKEIKALRKELLSTKTLAKVIDIESTIKILETMLEDLD